MPNFQFYKTPQAGSISCIPLAAKRLLLFILLQTTFFAGYTQSKAAADAAAPVKKLITLIRAGEDAQAMKQLDMNTVSKSILGNYFNTTTPQQLKEFISLFETLFPQIAFPKIRETMKDISSISYGTPDIKGAEAFLNSSIFIRQSLKTQELKLRYTLVKTSQGWKVKDAAILGDSILQSIRDDQAQPVLKDGGVEALLKVMGDKIATR